MWSSLNSNNNKGTYNEVLKCSGTRLCNVQWFVFLTPCTWAVTFLFLIRFERLLVCQMRQEEVFKFCLDTRNNRALALGPACPERLSVQSPNGLLYTSDDLRKCLGSECDWFKFFYFEKWRKNTQKLQTPPPPPPQKKNRKEKKNTASLFVGLLFRVEEEL
jgi:hypothetical protein